MSHRRTYRLRAGLGLQLRHQTPQAAGEGEAARRLPAGDRPNDVWAMGCLHDQLGTGRRLRVQAVVDTFSRFSPVLDARFSYRGEDMVRMLDAACGAVGHPRTIRVDQGSGFVARALDLWAYARGVMLDFSWLGTPTDSAFAEAFNGRGKLEA